METIRGLRVNGQLPEELTIEQMAEHEGCFVNMMVALLAFSATEAPSTDSPLEALRKEMVNQSSVCSAETDEADAPEGIFQYLRFEQFATIEDLLAEAKRVQTLLL